MRLDTMIEREQLDHIDLVKIDIETRTRGHAGFWQVFGFVSADSSDRNIKR